MIAAVIGCISKSKLLLMRSMINIMLRDDGKWVGVDGDVLLRWQFEDLPKTVCM